MPSLIVRDPFFDLFAWDVARRGQRTAFAVQARGEEKEEFLLLLRRQRFRGLFDLGERAHEGQDALPRAVRQRGTRVTAALCEPHDARAFLNAPDGAGLELFRDGCGVLR